MNFRNGALWWGVLLLCSSLHAQTVIHILSPWVNDPAAVANRHHLYGNATGYSANDDTRMEVEGDGWFQYTWDASVTFSYEAITLRNCPVASDANCNGGIYWEDGTDKIELGLTEIFGEETEIWIYPDNVAPNYYHIELDPPGSQFVWFKSPWGNKTLPNMIVGADTVQMRAVSDSAYCGWFVGALRPNKPTDVYFQRPYTDLHLPITATVDLSTVLQSQDSVFIDGTTDPLVADVALGSVGTCFDSSRTVHVLNPWISDAHRRDMPLYFSAGNLQNADSAMDSTGEMKYWWRFDFSPEMVAKTQEWSWAKLQIRSFYPEKGQGYLTHPHTPALVDLFPKGEYEVWLIPRSDSTFDWTYAPLYPRQINLLSPWSTTTPSLVVAGDTIKMFRITGKCGWYTRIVYENLDTWDVFFKQTIGAEFYSQEGLEKSTPINLDSMFALSDTVWMMPSPYPTGSPVFSQVFPGQLGDCGERSLAVMVLDWLGEGEGGTESYQAKNTIDVDFGGVYSGTDGSGSCQGLVLGMVEDTLGPNGVPQKNDSFSDSLCDAAEELNTWFIPVEVVPGYTNATCRDIPLTLDDDGFWMADYYEDEATNVPGFFPLDDFKYLDEAKTILNPKWDSVNGGWKGYHNYSFSMVVQAEFEYYPGQYFEFRGDDDVWVFINRRLVVDIGGVHGPMPGSVDLDSLGLIEGQSYPFHIFFAERNATGSNFKMRTSMDLQTKRSYYPVQVDAPPGILRYDIYQILVEASLSCNFNEQGSVDTVLAPSVFTLDGPQFSDGPVPLIWGINYGGVTIDSNYSSFNIDTAAIILGRFLAPGTYTLTFSHSLDPSLSAQVNFIVPPYPLPSIVFIDSLLQEIDPDTVELGEWAFVPYPVSVEARYVGVYCSDCSEILQLTTSDFLVFVDANRNPITSVQLVNGRATFWVMSNQAVTNASFWVTSGSVANDLQWKNINLKEPPVPFLEFAQMHDRNGDGIGDSLVFAYSRSIAGEDAPDSLSWKWGLNEMATLSSSALAQTIWLDSMIVITNDNLVDHVYTGNKDGSIYSGASITFFTYNPSGGTDPGSLIPFEISAAIEDHIGPIIEKAEISPGKIVDTLYLELSENLLNESMEPNQMLHHKVWRTGVDVSAQITPATITRKSKGERWMLLYSNAGEVDLGVGDSVKLQIGIPRDLRGNAPHINNPWVRITGKQRIQVESIPLVVLSPVYQPPKDSITRIVRVLPGQTPQDLQAQEGILGHIIHYDLANLKGNYKDLDPSQVSLSYRVRYFTNLGAYVNHTSGEVSCADVIFEGDCVKHPGGIFVGWTLQSSNGRKVGTGVYIAELYYEIHANGETVVRGDSRELWGVRRGN